MQPISSFNSNLGTAILLLGPPGAGKTTLGCRLFPKTYVSITDLNFKTDYLASIKELSNVVGFDQPSFKDGKLLQANQRYDNMMQQLNAAIASPDVDCIFCDGVTFMEPIIKAKICGALKDEMIRLEGFDQWGKYLLFWQSFIMQLRQSGKKCIFSGHEEKEQDKSDGVFRYGLAIDGKIKSKFPAYFSDVIRCEVAENLGKHAWQARTLGNISHELKNSFNLPAIVSQDELVKKIRATLSK